MDRGISSPFFIIFCQFYIFFFDSLFGEMTRFRFRDVCGGGRRWVGRGRVGMEEEEGGGMGVMDRGRGHRRMKRNEGEDDVWERMGQVRGGGRGGGRTKPPKRRVYIRALSTPTRPPPSPPPGLTRTSTETDSHASRPPPRSSPPMWGRPRWRGGRTDWRRRFP